MKSLHSNGEKVITSDSVNINFYWWQWKYLQVFQFSTFSVAKTNNFCVEVLPPQATAAAEYEWLCFESFEYFMKHKSLWTYHFRSHLGELHRKLIRRKRFFARQHFDTTFKEPAISFLCSFKTLSRTRSIYFPFAGNILSIFHHMGKRVITQFLKLSMAGKDFYGCYLSSKNYGFKGGDFKRRSCQ